jgi:hypothetical protein
LLVLGILLLALLCWSCASVYLRRLPSLSHHIRLYSLYTSSLQLLPPKPTNMFGAFLIDPAFWSRIGFLISFIATSLIALEVMRLVGTDANKREVEKFLDSYSKQRAASPPRRVKQISVNIDELESGRPVTPPQPEPTTTTTTVRPVRAAVTPESDKVERRKRATSSASQARATRTSSPTPLRKLRKRSDTLTSTGSSESRRRHREASPASESGSRHGSPRPRSREDKKSSGLGLSKLMRAKV